MKKTNKKGASAVLAYVLLITVTVILAVTVTVFMKGKAKEQAQIISEEVGSRLGCDSVAINAFIDGANVHVINVGSKTVDVEVRYLSVDPQLNQQLKKIEVKGLKPRDVRTPNDLSTRREIPIGDKSRGDKVEILPKIKIDDKIFVCADKKAVVG
jgi:FlaG/FlaF family flagellin (archaellin)